MIISKKRYDELNARTVELSRTVKALTQVINSLEDDIKSLREEAYKTAKKRTRRPTKSN